MRRRNYWVKKPATYAQTRNIKKCWFFTDALFMWLPGCCWVFELRTMGIPTVCSLHHGHSKKTHRFLTQSKHTMEKLMFYQPRVTFRKSKTVTMEQQTSFRRNPHKNRKEATNDETARKTCFSRHLPAGDQIMMTFFCTRRMFLSIAA